MRNYKLTLAYDGSRYKGWQRLGAGELTIQDTLENVMSKMFACSIRIQGSGRTDAGVHARGQVASVKVKLQKERKLLEEEFQTKMNQMLPFLRMSNNKEMDPMTMMMLMQNLNSDVAPAPRENNNEDMSGIKQELAEIKATLTQFNDIINEA
mgnify:CR=1 FL=1